MNEKYRIFAPPIDLIFNYFWNVWNCRPRSYMLHNLVSRVIYTTRTEKIVEEPEEEGVANYRAPSCSRQLPHSRGVKKKSSVCPRFITTTANWGLVIAHITDHHDWIKPRFHGSSAVEPTGERNNALLKQPVLWSMLSWSLQIWEVSYYNRRLRGE